MVAKTHPILAASLCAFLASHAFLAGVNANPHGITSSNSGAANILALVPRRSPSQNRPPPPSPPSSPSTQNRPGNSEEEGEPVLGDDENVVNPVESIPMPEGDNFDEVESIPMPDDDTLNGEEPIGIPNSDDRPSSPDSNDDSNDDSADERVDVPDADSDEEVSTTSAAPAPTRDSLMTSTTASATATAEALPNETNSSTGGQPETNGAGRFGYPGALLAVGAVFAVAM